MVQIKRPYTYSVWAGTFYYSLSQVLFFVSALLILLSVGVIFTTPSVPISSAVFIKLILSSFLLSFPIINFPFALLISNEVLGRYNEIV